MRKTKEVTIAAEGRDLNKKFEITEMPAAVAEAWGMRALGAMARSGIEIPDDVIALGLLGFKLVGLRAFLAGPWTDVKPLLDEMAGCWKRIEPQVTRPLVENDIEEIATLTTLRDETLELHLGFSLAADLLGAAAALSQSQASSISPISPAPSGSSSPEDQPPSTSSRPSTP